MYLSLVFWLGLALPGYVVVRRASPRDAESGLLGTIGLSYLATLGLLSPISILCYILHAPALVFSCACVTLMAAAMIEITRQRWWRDVGKLVAGGACVELAVVVADIVLGGRIGSPIGGDAVVHLARIRTLLDAGFNNQNPFVAAEAFFPIYHTNILHALCAACAQVTGVDYLGVWYAGIVWGKLLVASGAFYLAWCVFERQWVAWVAAVFIVAQHGPVTFMIYPNKIAPLWVLPYMMGFAIQACRGQCSWITCGKLGIGSLVIGQVHGLYAIFAALTLGPVLLGGLVVRLVRRHSDRLPAAACLLAIAIGLCFPIVSKLHTPAFSARDRSGHLRGTAEKPAFEKDVAYRYFDDGLLMKKPLRSFGGRYGMRFIAIALGVACTCYGARRKEVALLAAMIATVAAVLYIPQLCTAALDTLGRTWMLSRLEIVLTVGFTALAPCAAAYLVESRTRFWWVRALLSLSAGGVAILLAGQKPPYNWPAYVQRSMASPEQRLEFLDYSRLLSSDIKKLLPPGETVLATGKMAMYFVMLDDCHIVAPETATIGIPDLYQRRLDLELMLASETEWPIKRKLLRKYKIKYFIPTGGVFEWARPHTRQMRKIGTIVLLTLIVD